MADSRDGDLVVIGDRDNDDSWIYERDFLQGTALHVDRTRYAKTLPKIDKLYIPA
tara:strand:+ start:600 stop:764 length:165 start_codon:yes stop_codon:yes gene_type:complete